MMTEALPLRALSELIGSIYDCALAPDLWEPTLLQIRDAMNCHTAVLALVDSAHSRFLISKTVGIPPEVFERQKNHVPEMDHWTRTYGASLGPDEPFVVSRHVPAEVVVRSPYWGECVAPYGVVDILQYLLMQTHARLAAFAFARHESQGLVTEREVELGGLLLPHIRRAVTISNVLDARTIEKARMTETLNALQCGVVLTDERGAILFANASAEEMLSEGSAIRGAEGVLSAKALSAHKELASAIRLAANDEAQIGKTGLSVRLTGLDEAPQFAHVLPMNGSELRTRLQPTAAAAVFIGRPEPEGEGAALAAAFGLTPAETHVLTGLLAGRTRGEMAAHLGITLATAKTHLINVFAKTGVKRQAELMRLAARVLPPVKRQP